jgi:formimidoylglutamate deiminase
MFAERALLADGWARDVRVTLGADGRIAAVETGAVALAGDERLAGRILLPAPSNLHSHAFQRAMAGMTEARGPDPSDSFWTWRKLMYHFLETLSPGDVEAIAALVQVEMAEAGYAAVGEFHYLHNRPGGGAYDNPAELAARIAAAADQTGLGLTMLPVLYMQGGCDGRPLAGGQLRFSCDFGQYGRILEGAVSAVAGLPADTRVGVAPHSLRAVPLEAVRAVARLRPDDPVHIHAAEQVAEVVEVEAAYGARPVALLLDRVGIDARWCLIHTTHMERAETQGLARSGAVAGLCPVTESNLGDGIFDGVRFRAAGGRGTVPRGGRGVRHRIGFEYPDLVGRRTADAGIFAAPWRARAGRAGGAGVDRAGAFRGRRGRGRAGLRARCRGDRAGSAGGPDDTG